MTDEEILASFMNDELRRDIAEDPELMDALRRAVNVELPSLPAGLEGAPYGLVVAQATIEGYLAEAEDDDERRLLCKAADVHLEMADDALKAIPNAEDFAEVRNRLGRKLAAAKRILAL